jgi:RNA polymerase sigma-70 factor, ECF subfamily
MQDLTDEELLEKFRTDAQGVWLDELFARYHARVAVWCYRFTGDRESAGDLAQDIFLRAYRNLDSFRGASKFSTWLYTITRNHCFNEVKARGSRVEHDASVLDFDVEDGKSQSILDILEKEQSFGNVQALFEKTLDETEQKVMMLHFAHEVKLDAVTRLLGLTNPSGARAYVLSSKRKLTAALQRWSGGRDNKR